MLRENPVVKRMFEIGEGQLARLAQELMNNETFVNALQTLMGNTLKAKGLLDKNIRLALTAMNLPTVADLRNLERKLGELEATLARLEAGIKTLNEK